MKKLSSPTHIVFFLIIGVSLAFFSVAFGSGAAMSQSATPTPTPALTKAELALEVGSTDGIMIWAVLITLIIIVPILWDWVQWKRKSKD